MYLDQIRRAGDENWHIAVVKLTPQRSQSYENASKIEEGEGYVLKTVGTNGEVDFQVIKSHAEFIDWSRAPEFADRLVASHQVKLITMTITLGGYFMKDDGELNAEDATIAGELKGEPASSVYAFLAGSLKARMEDLNEPITICSCDNVRQNGIMLKRNTLKYLELKGDMKLREWVEKNCTFPCSMVRYYYDLFLFVKYLF